MLACWQVLSLLPSRAASRTLAACHGTTGKHHGLSASATPQESSTDTSGRHQR
jgi:hypothetical protein